MTTADPARRLAAAHERLVAALRRFEAAADRAVADRAAARAACRKADAHVAAALDHARTALGPSDDAVG